MNSRHAYSFQDIGEEFVEFLEKELSITDSDSESNSSDDKEQGSDPSRSSGGGAQGMGNANRNEAARGRTIEDDIDDIEATLAQLKKELGL